MKELLPREMAAKVEATLHDLHRARLRDARFHVEAFLEENRVVVRFTLATPDKSLHYPMEAGCVLETDDAAEIEEKLELATDFLGYYVQEYLDSDGEVLLTIDWKEHSFGGQAVYARGWERNLALEDAADRFLDGETLNDDELRRLKDPRKR